MYPVDICEVREFEDPFSTSTVQDFGLAPYINAFQVRGKCTGQLTAIQLCNFKSTEDIAESWQFSLDRLSSWSRQPELLADEAEGLVAPTPLALQLATREALLQQDAGKTPPSVVSADGEGGVSFEWFAGDEHKSLRFEADGAIWLLEFKDAKLLVHKQLA